MAVRGGQGVGKKEIEIKGSGIRVSVLAIVFLALGVIVMIGSFFSITKIYSRYDAIRDSYSFTESEREAANSFKKASDYLTEQARLYAATGDITCADNYFREKDVLQNREAALERVERERPCRLQNREIRIA